MGALCKAVAAATARGWAAALLLLCFLTSLAAAQTAVGPSASVKPLYGGCINSSSSGTLCRQHVEVLYSDAAAKRDAFPYNFHG
jgi:hypothetical protein